MAPLKKAKVGSSAKSPANTPGGATVGKPSVAKATPIPLQSQSKPIATVTGAYLSNGPSQAAGKSQKSSLAAGRTVPSLVNARITSAASSFASQSGQQNVTPVMRASDVKKTKVEVKPNGTSLIPSQGSAMHVSLAPGASKPPQKASPAVTGDAPQSATPPASQGTLSVPGVHQAPKTKTASSTPIAPGVPSPPSNKK